MENCYELSNKVIGRAKELYEEYDKNRHLSLSGHENNRWQMCR